LFSIFITRIVLKCSVTAVFFELKKTKNDLEITTEQMLVILFTFALNKMVGIFLRKLFVKFVLSDRVRSVKLYRKLSQKRLKRTKKKKKGENWMLPSHVNRKYSFTAIFVWLFILSLNTVNISFLLLFGFQLKREGDIKHALFLRCVLLSIGSWVFLTSPLRILFFSVQSWSKLLQSDRGKRKRGETRRRLRTEKLALVQKQSSPERESVSVEMASRISMSPNKHTSRESLRRASYLESTKRLELVTSKKHAAKSKKVKTQKLEGGGREKETIPEENVVANPLWKGSSKKRRTKLRRETDGPEDAGVRVKKSQDDDLGTRKGNRSEKGEDQRENKFAGFIYNLHSSPFFVIEFSLKRIKTRKLAVKKNYRLFEFIKFV
jgi:hypothetical protein